MNDDKKKTLVCDDWNNTKSNRSTNTKIEEFAFENNILLLIFGLKKIILL